MGCWSNKQKKAYHRLLGGMIRHRREKCRFMTLTTSDDMCRTLKESWSLLRMRLSVTYPYQFIIDGWLSYDYCVDLYGEDNLFSPLSFQYCKIVTSEGVAGVIHCVFFGCFLPKSWLSSTWYEVTGGAYIVDVRAVYASRVYNQSRLASYSIEQYTGFS